MSINDKITSEGSYFNIGSRLEIMRWIKSRPSYKPPTIKDYAKGFFDSAVSVILPVTPIILVFGASYLGPNWPVDREVRELNNGKKVEVLQTRSGSVVYDGLIDRDFDRIPDTYMSPDYPLTPRGLGMNPYVTLTKKQVEEFKEATEGSKFYKR